MFWKKAPEKPSAAAPSASPSAVGDEDRALDTIALLLRSYGETAFDVAEATATEIRSQCEDWAKRIVVGGGRDREEGGGALRRDWGGVRRFFAEQRKAEVDFVRGSLGDLREALHAFSRCMIETVADDRAADADVQRGIDQLSTAVARDDPEAIRRAATDAVDLVRRTLAARKERQDGQLQALRSHVSSLQQELDEARGELEIDPLTQLFGPTALHQHAERLSDLGLLLATPPSLILVRVDGFAALDADLGRAGSDVVLRELANALLRCFLRREDFVARLGTDGFAIIVAEPTLEAAAELAERAIDGVRKHEITTSRGPLRVTISLSVTQLRQGERSSEWLERGERALASACERRDALVVVDPCTGLDAWRSESVRPAGRPSRPTVRSSGRPAPTRSLPPRTSGRPAR